MRRLLPRLKVTITVPWSSRAPPLGTVELWLWLKGPVALPGSSQFRREGARNWRAVLGGFSGINPFEEALSWTESGEGLLTCVLTGVRAL